MKENKECRHNTLELFGSAFIQCMDCSKTWYYESKQGLLNKVFQHKKRIG